MFVTPVRDETGRVGQHFVSLVDHTQHQQEQARCEMLIGELNHRVKNTLSTVQAIARQSLRSAADPIRDAIESRLFALARSHDLLTKENWEGAALLELVKTALEPFMTNGGSERLRIAGDNVRLTPKATLALGIAFHELATNAAKYGALTNDSGLILLAWKIAPAPGGNRLIIEWREKDGPAVAPPPRKGFGSQVIERGLPHELRGRVQLDYPAAGLICTIDIPAPNVASDG
jgi:two-component sensor histidine kinase